MCGCCWVLFGFSYGMWFAGWYSGGFVVSCLVFDFGLLVVWFVLGGCWIRFDVGCCCVGVRGWLRSLLLHWFTYGLRVCGLCDGFVLVMRGWFIGASCFGFGGGYIALVGCLGLIVS